jgi:hypothetical protein
VSYPKSVDGLKQLANDVMKAHQATGPDQRGVNLWSHRQKRRSASGATVPSCLGASLPKWDTTIDVIDSLNPEENGA